LSKVLDLPVVEELINQVTAVWRDIEEIARLINNNAVVRKKVNRFYKIRKIKIVLEFVTNSSVNSVGLKSELVGGHSTR
jgi:hypothetical protein